MKSENKSKAFKLQISSNQKIYDETKFLIKRMLDKIEKNIDDYKTTNKINAALLSIKHIVLAFSYYTTLNDKDKAAFIGLLIHFLNRVSGFICLELDLNDDIFKGTLNVSDIQKIGISKFICSYIDKLQASLIDKYKKSD